MKSTNIIKIILKNLFLIIIIFILFEIAAFNIESFKFSQKIKKSAGFYSKNDIKYSFTTYDFSYDDSVLRPVVKKGNKHSIVLFGCSFAYGGGLNEKQTFSYKLAKAANSTVYNRASPGWGAQQMLYQLREENFYNQITPPDYIIYTFIGDQIYRLNQYQWGGMWGNRVNLRYKEENGKLAEVKPSFKPLWFLFTVKEMQRLNESYLNSQSHYSKNFDLYSLIMEESLKTAKKHYPNVKFVILIYSNCYYPNKINVAGFKNLEKDGFIVVKTKDIIKEDLSAPIYHFGQDGHPTEKAWDVIVPALVKKLNL